MYSLISKIFAGLTAFLWADKKRLFLGLFASFWAIQHVACAYGCGSATCADGNDDPALKCHPVYDKTQEERVVKEYRCENGETVSVEEGERRNKQRENNGYEFEQY